MQTAIERLKSILAVFPSVDPRVVGIPGLLTDWIQSKGYPEAALRKMLSEGVLSLLVFNRLLRRSGNSDLYRYWLESALNRHRVEFDTNLEAYRATAQQNAAIDAAPYRSLDAPNRQLVFIGAASKLAPTNFTMSAPVKATPIIIIGTGPSGYMAAHALYRAGFTKISMIDKSPTNGGIWQQDNVRLSRNNPRPVNMIDRLSLNPAPGSGEEVLEFVNDSARDTEIFARLTGTVTKVDTALLNYAVHYVTRESAVVSVLRAPIVINCMGLGKPKPLSDESRMTCGVTDTEAGPRWQQILDPSKVKGKRLCFIGLGNSTAEMIVQMERFIRAGVDTDYRVLTHYPNDAIQSPEFSVSHKAQTFRVFRDLSIPNLTSFEGDLDEPRAAYFSALRSDKIIPNVKHWHKNNNRTVGLSTIRRGRYDREIPIDQTYPLIGYQIQPETYRSMGIPIQAKEPQYDYDGEFSGLHGYFGLGAVLETSWNKNAVVIPGNAFRLNDLLAGVVLRAYQYQEKQQSK